MFFTFAHFCILRFCATAKQREFKALRRSARCKKKRGCWSMYERIGFLFHNLGF